MIVGDFDLIHPMLRPAEAEAVLLVDADAVLPSATAGKGFQTIAGWRSSKPVAAWRISSLVRVRRRMAAGNFRAVWP